MDCIWQINFATAPINHRIDQLELVYTEHKIHIVQEVGDSEANPYCPTCSNHRDIKYVTPRQIFLSIPQLEEYVAGNALKSYCSNASGGNKTSGGTTINQSSDGMSVDPCGYHQKQSIFNAPRGFILLFVTLSSLFSFLSFCTACSPAVFSPRISICFY